MDAKKIEEMKDFVEHRKQSPSDQSLDARILAFGESCNDGEYEDKKPLESKKPNVSMEDSSNVESDVELDNSDIVEPDNDPPHKSKDGEEYEDKKLFESKKPNVSMDDSSNDKSVESDVELDNSDIVEPDNDPPQKMGDQEADVIEENQKAAKLSNAKAKEAIAYGKFNEAIAYLTDAIMLNPKSAKFYANRANIFIKLKKPNAAIRDADAALQIDPDLAKGFKARGLAKTSLGLWEEAARDFHAASKLELDYDEEIEQMRKKVETNANKIEEHIQKYERLHKEKELTKTEFERKRHRDAEAASLSKHGEVITIHSASDLKEKLNAASETSRLSILYFTATWCGPCRYVAPIFTSLAAKYPNTVFLKVDIDEARDAAAEWRPSCIPCFFFVRNGVEVDQFIGVYKNEIEKKFAHHAG